MKYTLRSLSGEHWQYIWGGIQSRNHPNDGSLSNEWPHALEPTDNLFGVSLLSDTLLIFTNIYTTFDGIYDQKLIKTYSTQCHCKAILVYICFLLSRCQTSQTCIQFVSSDLILLFCRDSYRQSINH